MSTFSEPGFDSYYSGNTTDICPVGALTTADFRFGARPWELNAAASICAQCPVGCNLTFNVRREAKSGGSWAIKRVMPRQHEAVNEIWICDKGRFAYHYTESKARITQPLVRKNGELTPVPWKEALQLVSARFREAGDGLVTLASGRLSNEDLFNLKQLTDGLGGKSVLYSHMGGGDLVSKVGVAPGTNFGDLGPESTIVVVASDLQEEAPVWWLRVKQAAERGAALIVINPRPTRLDKFARHVVRYAYGSEGAAVLAMVNALSAKRPDLPESVSTLARSDELQSAAKTAAEAENRIILYGSEGIGLEASTALAQACANLLVTTGHVGRPNNGLIGVWQRANDQGAWDMGFVPTQALPEMLSSARALYIIAADPAGDDPGLAETGDFLVVQELFLTDTAKLADVVLPALAYTEREGSYTSGERRVQRFYPALPPRSDCKADFAIAGEIGRLLGLEMEARVASLVMTRLAASLTNYVGEDGAPLSYTKLSQVVEQWPVIGRGDLYYGGTTYENSQGLGVQLAPGAQRGEPLPLGWNIPPETHLPEDGLLAVPITRLYDRGQTVLPSKLLHQRIPQPYVAMHPDDAGRLDILDGATIELSWGGTTSFVTIRLDETVPASILLVPRSMGVPLYQPQAVEVRQVERQAA